MKKVAAVFKRMLTLEGVNVPVGWNTEAFGAGILDVKKLLEAELPPIEDIQLDEIRAHEVDFAGLFANLHPRLPADVIHTLIPRESDGSFNQRVAAELSYRSLVDKRLQQSVKEVELAEFGTDAVAPLASTNKYLSKVPLSYRSKKALGLSDK